MQRSFLAITALSILLLFIGCQDPVAPPSPSHTVRYQANGASGTPPTDENTYPAGAVVTVRGKGALQIPGYGFRGWQLQPTGGSTNYGENTTFIMGGADVDFYAQWQPNQNTITFEANGGTGTMGPQQIAFGTRASITFNRFTRPGYTFTEWNTQADGKGTVYLNTASYTMGLDNLVLFAQWSPVLGTISFYGNHSAASGIMKPQGLATDATAGLSPCTLENEGFTFLGWNTQSDGGGKGYADKAEFTMGTANVDLYAQWKANQNTLTFDANGGTGTMVPQQLATFEYAKLTANAFTYGGSYFSGWCTKADGTGQYYGNEQSFQMGRTDLTLYARWQNYHPVSFPVDTPFLCTVTILGMDSLWVGSPSTFRSRYNGTAAGYRWFFNGVEIPGADADTLTYVLPAAAAVYGPNVLMLEVTDANGITFAGVLNLVVRY